MRAKRAININDGRIVIRTEATDALHGLYRPIPDDIVDAINKGKVTAMKVVDAIMKKDRFDPDWSWKKFQEEQRALNIRQSDVDLGDEEPEKQEPKDDEPGSLISLEEVTGAKPKAQKKAAASEGESVGAEQVNL